MKCYVTIVTTESYFPGVKMLRDSLMSTGPNYEFRIFVPTELYDKLMKTGDYQESEVISYQYEYGLSEDILADNEKTANPQWNYTFDKILFFGRTEFEKIVYLDCDMEIQSNIDELFERPHMAAVNPSLGNDDYKRGFNSGLMVIVPEAGLDRRILALLESDDFRKLHSVSDNDLLQLYYRNWGEDKNQILGDEYNVFYPYRDMYTDINEIKVMHYIGAKKPWM